MEKVFETLYALNVNDYVEQKDTGSAKLSYLSWSYAVAEVSKKYPNWNYEIVRQENGLPYVYDPQTGYLVATRVTIDGVTREMWLPVMDGQNRAMKAEPYKIQTKYKEITVASATMMDINKAIMRCLVKNLGMFGLGLYIYAGEDLPEGEEEEKKVTKAQPKTPPKTSQKVSDGHVERLITAEHINELGKKMVVANVTTEQILKLCNVNNISDMTETMYEQVNKKLDATIIAKKGK